MSIVPITSAQGIGAKSNIFYVNKDGYLTTWVAPEEPEQQQADVRYASQFVTLSDGTKFVCSSNDLAALAYEWGTNPGSKVPSTRVYWADSNNILQELCKDGPDGSWFLGSLGDQNIKCAKGTTLSAHVNFWSSQLKVYYYTPGDQPQKAVAWTKLGDDKWLWKTI